MNALPSPWVGLVLALAVFRVTRLIGWDDLPVLMRLRARATGEYIYRDSTASKDLIYRYKHPSLAKFLGCAYCQGFWISLGVYLAWLFVPTGTLYGAAPFALSAAVGITARMLDP